MDKIPGQVAADCFFFDYGCLVFWGLDQKQEKELVNNIYKTLQVRAGAWGGAALRWGRDTRGVRRALSTYKTVHIRCRSSPTRHMRQVWHSKDSGPWTEAAICLAFCVLYTSFSSGVQSAIQSFAQVEIDDFQFNFSSSEAPHINNDVFTINKRQASDHQVITFTPSDHQVTLKPSDQLGSPAGRPAACSASAPADNDHAG